MVKKTSYLKFILDRIPYPTTRQGILRICLALGLGSALIYALYPKKKKKSRKHLRKISSSTNQKNEAKQNAIQTSRTQFDSPIHKSMTSTTSCSLQSVNTPKFFPKNTRKDSILLNSDQESTVSSFTTASQLRYGSTVRFNIPGNQSKFTEDVNLMTNSGRKELFDCLTGMEKLVNCAQAAIESDSCQASQITVTSRHRNSSNLTINSQSATVQLLEAMRDQITEVKTEILQNSEDITISTPVSIPRKPKMPSISAMSTLSFETDHWFSCSSGDITPPEILAFSNESENKNLELYDKYLEKVSEVKFRKDRHEIVGCCNFNEYLAKMQIIRQSFVNLEILPSLKPYLLSCGRYLLSGIIKSNGHQPTQMLKAYEKFILYSQTTEAESQLSEVKHRGVAMFNVYDMVLDYMILDAFDDLSNPPSTVTTVLQNRWLGNQFKETALATAVWSIIKAKKGRIKVENGFYYHYYSLWETISPVMAWGFMGPTDMTLSKVCNGAKSELQGMIKDMFSFTVMDWSEQPKFDHCMVESILRRVDNCLNLIQNYVLDLKYPPELTSAKMKVLSELQTAKF